LSAETRADNLALAKVRASLLTAQQGGWAYRPCRQEAVRGDPQCTQAQSDILPKSRAANPTRVKLRGQRAWSFSDR